MICNNNIPYHTVITVEPPFNEVPRDWGNVFIISMVLYIVNLDLLYFVITVQLQILETSGLQKQIVVIVIPHFKTVSQHIWPFFADALKNQLFNWFLLLCTHRSFVDSFSHRCYQILTDCLWRIFERNIDQSIQQQEQAPIFVCWQIWAWSCVLKWPVVSFPYPSNLNSFFSSFANRLI